MYRRPIKNETLKGEIYKAIPNEIGKYETISQNFYYRFLEKSEQRMYKPLKGVISEESSVFLCITNLSYDVNVGDKIVLHTGDSMIVNSYGILYDPNKMLNMGKFSPIYLERILPKVVSLKN